MMARAVDGPECDMGTGRVDFQVRNSCTAKFAAKVTKYWQHRPGATFAFGIVSERAVERVIHLPVAQ
jgi:hypothetical protein